MTQHKQGCDALGGYGHGIGPCTCGAAMNNDNQDALRCAAAVRKEWEINKKTTGELLCAADHLDRLVAENEAKDALLRQAVEALDVISGDVCLHVHHAKKDQHDYDEVCPVHVRHCEAIAAIRQHLDQKTT